ncbi:hypothetical protein LJC23_06165 [Desulfovibrio sp. OttesenSCG-928-I05]|nr:hypothetical protein [Desulfovibrio sp. OttesenSCG-928-I05]
MPYRFRVLLFAVLLMLPLASCVARQDVDSVVKGEQPEAGRVVLRSGLAWLDESSPVYQPLWAELRRVCEEKDWRVVPVPPSRMKPLPDNPVPGGSGGVRVPDASVYTAAESGLRQPRQFRADGRPEAGEDLRTQAKAAELARAGKLPATRLQGYASPANDAELPPSVMAVTPPDIATYLFALSQLRGRPLLRGVPSIPLHIPQELTTDDPARADYAILVRFAVIAQPVRGSGRTLNGGRSSGGSAGTLIRGVGSLGFGASGSTGLYGGNTRGSGSMSGYMRGYDGNAPGSDMWHRDADYRRRDYARLVGPKPVESAAPQALSGDVNREVPQSLAATAGAAASALPAVSAPSGGEYLVLELEIYDLAPARDGDEARVIWSGKAAASGPFTGTEQIAASLAELAASLL